MSTRPGGIPRPSARPGAGSSLASSGRVGFVALAALALLALGLRCIAIGFESIWYDEWHSLLLSSRSPAELWTGLLNDTHPPLYFWLLGLWRRAAGDSVEAARLFSAVWAAAMVPAVYALARSLRCGPPVAWVAAALAVFVPFTLYHGQQIRMYTLLTTLGALLLAWAGRILRQLEATPDRLRPAELLGWLALAVSLVYVHNYGVFLCASAGVWAAVEAGVQRRWRPLLVFAALGFGCLLGALPQLGRALYTMENVRNFDWILSAGQLEIETPWRVADALLAGPWLDPGLLPLRWLLVLAVAAGAVWLWIAPAEEAEAGPAAAWRRRTPLLLTAFLIAAPMAVSLARPIMIHGQRYMVYCIPLLLVVLGQVTVALRPRARLALLALLASVWLPYTWSFLGERHQIDLAGATRELEARVEPGADAVLVWPGLNHRVVRFLSQGQVPAQPLLEKHSAAAGEDPTISRVWLLSESAAPTRGERELTDDFRPVRSRHWPTAREGVQLRLSLYERR